MRVSRLIWFLVAMALGVVAGLAIGWYASPRAMGQVSPASLRSDYRTDYVLMVAEIFDSEKDLPAALRWLQWLGDDSPARIAQVAVIRAGELGFDRRDLELLAKLSQALLAYPPGATPPAGGRP